MSSVFENFSISELNNTEDLAANKQAVNIFGNAQVPELATYLPAYRTAVAAEDEAMVKLKASAKTEQLRDKDHERDHVFRVGGSYIEVLTRHWDPQVANAAKVLKVIHHQFNQIPVYNYKKESEEIVNYLQAMGDIYSMNATTPAGGGTGGMTGGTGGGMSGSTGGMGGSTGTNYIAAVQTLNFGSWLDKLRELNDEFVAIYESRADDKLADALLSEAKTARHNADNLLRGCLNLIDLLVLTNGIAPYRQLITEINLMIQDWNTTVNIRKGWAKAAKEKENNGGSSNTTPENNDGENNEGGENSDDNQGEDNTPSADA